MNLLLTGAYGFLGQNVIPFFKPLFRMKTLGIFQDNDYSTNLAKEIPKLNESFEIVFHAAGLAHSNKKLNENDFYEVNFNGTVNLCKALENSSLPKSFVYISTVAVYGLDEGENIDESNPLIGKSPYAKSKIKAEKFLIGWAEKNSVILTILRLPLIVGPNPPGSLGAMINGIKSGKYVSIGKANAKKSMIWVEDIPKFILKIKDRGGIFNLTDNYSPSFSELESVIANKLNKSKPKKIPYFVAKLLAYVGDIVGSKFPIDNNKLKKITSTLTFSCEKAMKDVDWKPDRVLDKF